MRELIVNADDFGRSERTNDGIVRAHEHGIVTSASLMVRWPAARGAAAYARANPRLSVGLHLDLGEWAYSAGRWSRVYEHPPTAAELSGQLEYFRELVGRDPTHVDSHQHVHRDEPLATHAAELADALGVPLRERGPIRYVGGFYGQSGRGEPCPSLIEVEALVRVVASLEPGVTELGCHPGLDAELDSSYRLERLLEVRTLCHPRAREAIARAGVILRSFAAQAAGARS